MQKMLLVIGDKDSKFAEIIEETAQRNGKLLKFEVLSSAAETRSALMGGSYDEAWVFSCNDMGTVNLSAALAKEEANVAIYAASEKDASCSESLKSDLGIHELLSKSELEELLLEKLNAIANENVTEASQSKASTEVIPNNEPVTETKEAEGDILDELENLFEPDEPNEITSISDTAGAQKPVKATDKAKKSAFILSVMSGGGGVGKSTTVATASYLAASKGFSVIVVDCDLQFGDMHQLMGEVPCTSVDDILIDKSLFMAFARSCNRDIPALVCAPKRLERSEELANHLDEILDLCASLFDVVFINTGSSWSEVNAQLIEKSSCNLFMIDQRASSVRACQHAIELCMRMGLATGQFIYALNRCERSSLFCAMDVVNAMQGANVVELKDGGQEVEELLAMGLAGELAASKNDFTNSLNEMLVEVLP